MDKWVYEMFITKLDADGILVENFRDLYHGRGAFDIFIWLDYHLSQLFCKLVAILS